MKGILAFLGGAVVLTSFFFLGFAWEEIAPALAALLMTDS